MSTFNTTRFGQALKCQFLVLRKTWIRLFGIFTLVMFMANLFFTRVNGVKYDDMVSQWPMEDVIIHYGNYVGSTTGFGVIFFCFSMLFGASFLFAGMKDTRKRSAFLLWPVSNLEKYIISLLLSHAPEEIEIYLWRFRSCTFRVLADSMDALRLGVLHPLALYRGRHAVPSPAVPVDQCHDCRRRHPAGYDSEPN